MGEQFEFELGAKDNVTRVIDAVKKSFDSLGKTVESVGSKSNQAFSVMAGVIGGNLITGAIEKVIGSVEDLANVFTVDAVKAAAEFQVSVNELNNALNRSGNYTKEASDDFLEFADTIQQTTTVSDDAAISSAALLESLTGLSEKGLKEATKAAIDLSAVTGKDLDTTVRALAKAFDGSGESLKKFGITLTSIRPGTEGFQNTLDQINKRFGGAAESQVNTYSGSLKRLGNSFDDLKKSVGAAVTDNLVLVSVISDINAILVGSSKSVKDNALAWRVGLGTAVLYATEALGYLGIAFDVVGKIGKAAFESAISPITVMNTSVKAIVDVITGVKTPFEAIKDIAGEIEKPVKTAFSVTELNAFSAKMAEISGNAKIALDNVANGATAASGPLGDAGKKTEELTDAMRQLQELGQQLEGSLVSPLAMVAASSEEAKLQLEQSTLDYNDTFIRSQDDLLLYESQYSEQRKQNLYNEFAIKSAALEARLKAEGASQEKHDRAMTALAQKTAQEDLKIDQETRRKKQQLEQQTREDRKATYQYISTLMQSSNQTLFRIGQAAALANAYISGQEAVLKALAAFPPPINFVMAGLVATAAAVNIANIAGAQPPKYARGITEVPAGFGGDTFGASLSTGERVVPASSNEDLKAFMAENAGSRSILVDISSKLDRLSNQIIVNIGGREIINEVRAGLQDGRVLAPV